MASERLVGQNAEVVKPIRTGGGWQAIRYSLVKAREVGPVRLWKAMRSKNACKTCALGMGGQLGGMTNEARHFPEVCKKSMQAMTADMQGKIEDRFWSTYTIDELRGLSSRELESCGRLSSPVIAEPGDSHYRPISWEIAFERIAEQLRQTDPTRLFLYSSGRSSNEAGFLLNLFARALGTNHLSNCSFYCHQASGVGLGESIGRGTATVSLDDLNHCDLLFLIGGNPASNHPRLMTTLVNLRARGGKVIVINPVKEVGLVNFRVPSNVKSMLFGSEIASTYVQPKIGGDIALMIGIAKALVAAEATDRDYLAEHTEGYSSIEELVNMTTWEEIERACGVSRSQIEDVAQVYAHSQKVVLAWTMGITHHEHGVENVQWITNLALLRGMVGKPGAGLLPIRGHSNVQGLGTVGVTPTMRESAIRGLTALGIHPPYWKGYDTLAAMEAAGRGEMDFTLCLGGNLFGASPDADFTSKAMAKLKMVAYISTTLNTGHVHGMGETTLILPVAARDEERQSTTQESMFNFVRLSDGGPERLGGPMTEVDVMAEIATRTCPNPGSLDWNVLRDHNEIRKLIGELIPPLQEIQDIGSTKKEFEIPGRVLHKPTFTTPSGKAVFHAHGIPLVPVLAANELQVMTVRSEGQFNTVVYEEKDLYRGQERRDVILMNPSDRKRLGLGVNQPVRVSNGCGVMDPVLVREFDIVPGCALMYYPEANVLVPRTIDPRSKTPAFKSVIVRIEPSERRPAPAAARDTNQRGDLKAC